MVQDPVTGETKAQVAARLTKGHSFGVFKKISQSKTKLKQKSKLYTLTLTISKLRKR